MSRKVTVILISLVSILTVFAIYFGFYGRESSEINVKTSAASGSAALTSQTEWREGTYVKSAVDTETQPGSIKLLLGKDGNCTHWFGSCDGSSSMYWGDLLGSNDSQYFKFAINPEDFPSDVDQAKLYLYGTGGYYSGNTPPDPNFIPYRFGKISSSWTEYPTMKYAPACSTGYDPEGGFFGIQAGLLDLSEYCHGGGPDENISCGPGFSGYYEINTYLEFPLPGGSSEEIMDTWGGPHGFCLQADFLDNITLLHREHAGYNPYMVINFTNGEEWTVYLPSYGGTSMNATHTTAPTQIDGQEGDENKTLIEWISFEPTATVPTNTSVSYEFRVSDDAENWTEWTSDFASLENRRYLQVRATLTSNDGVSTPRIDDYTIKFHNNLPPNAPTAETVIIGE